MPSQNLRLLCRLHPHQRQVIDSVSSHGSTGLRWQGSLLRPGLPQKQENCGGGEGRSGSGELEQGREVGVLWGDGILHGKDSDMI